MVPLKTFFDDRATFFHKNFRFKSNNNDNSLTLFKNRLKLIRENFAAVNNYYLNDVVSACNFSSPASVTTDEKNEYTWLNEMRSVTSTRLELLRKTMVAQTMAGKIEMWREKKELKLRNGEFEGSFKPKFQREEILIRKENYRLILDGIRKRADDEQQQQKILSNHRRRTREICFNATLTKAVSIVSIINNYFNSEQSVLNIGKQMEVYRSMESRLDVLKNVKVVDEPLLIVVKGLLEDLTSYKTNVVMAVQEKNIETRKSGADNKVKISNMFSVNMPNKLVIKNRVKQQYIALAKNHRALFKKLFTVKNLPFINDPNTKSFRQNVTKVINTLVNTISFISASHLTDKYNKLNTLLSGKLVCVANTRVMLGQNNEALLFCMETLASKIISYAEKVISVKVETAFELAEIITKLWSVHQQFGKILFAEIKQRCPLLVPFEYHVAKQLDKKSIGYKFDSTGNVESDNSYLKRMTGITRLYAAIIVTSSKLNQPVIGLSHAWIFVSTTLNQNPIADITAIMLVEFLNINGFIMHRMYGKQFIKLLQYIDTHYFKKIVMVTPRGHEGPISRLNSFISKSLYTGSIKEPKAMSSIFW